MIKSMHRECMLQSLKYNNNADANTAFTNIMSTIVMHNHHLEISTFISIPSVSNHIIMSASKISFAS